jgi:hypothetical protein
MLPLQFYVYCLLPELIWWAVARHWAAYMAALSHARSSMGLRRLFMFFVFHVIGIEILVSNNNIYALYDTSPYLDPVYLVLCYSTRYPILNIGKIKYSVCQMKRDIKMLTFACKEKIKKLKLSLSQAMEAYRVVRC